MVAIPSPLTAPHAPAKPKPLYRTLYFQVLVAVAIGAWWILTIVFDVLGP